MPKVCVVRCRPHGVAQPNINNSLRGKPPVRPAREGEEDYEGDNSTDMIITGERALSPEQGRAKSPNQFSSNRAISPLSHVADTQEPMSMVGAAAVIGVNGAAVAARSVSPQVMELGKVSLDDIYGPKPVSPVQNGFPTKGRNSQECKSRKGGNRSVAPFIVS